MIVVADSTPIISLLKIKRLGILEKLFGEVLIPPAVFDELVRNPDFRDEAEEIRSCRFIRSCEPEGGLSGADLIRRIGGIDIGESEAIMLTKALSADLLIIDEVKGRRAALDAGVRITGTIGVLLVAFKKKLLTAGEIEECVSGLRNAGRHIGEKHFEKLLGMIRR